MKGGMIHRMHNAAYCHRWILSKHLRTAIKVQCKIMAGRGQQKQKCKRKDLDTARILKDDIDNDDSAQSQAGETNAFAVLMEGARAKANQDHLPQLKTRSRYPNKGWLFNDVLKLLRQIYGQPKVKLGSSSDAADFVGPLTDALWYLQAFSHGCCNCKMLQCFSTTVEMIRKHSDYGIILEWIVENEVCEGFKTIMEELFTKNNCQRKTCYRALTLLVCTSDNATRKILTYVENGVSNLNIDWTKLMKNHDDTKKINLSLMV